MRRPRINGGLPVVVADTAGLRESDDLVLVGVGVQRGVEVSAFFSTSCSIDFTYRPIINSDKNADVALFMLP